MIAKATPTLTEVCETMQVTINVAKGFNVSLTAAQRGVVRGMAAGVVITIIVLGVGALIQPSGFLLDNPSGRMQVAAIASLAPTLALAVCIARLAAHRFKTPEDLDGGGLTAGTGKARVLQALLQNTLEQLALALPVYAAWSLLGPPHRLNMVLAASFLFLAGRLLFFRGYQRGAAGRAFGFALTFYPTVALLVGTIIFATVAGTGIHS
ncbi:MAG TPA: MAPEG family protein [Pseudoduganella sp.]